MVCVPVKWMFEVDLVREGDHTNLNMTLVYIKVQYKVFGEVQHPLEVHILDGTRSVQHYD